MGRPGSVSKVFRSNKKNTNGECPIAIRVTKDRETRLVHIGYSVDSKHWDVKQLRVKNNHPYCNAINCELDLKVKAINERITELTLKGLDYGIDDIIVNGEIKKSLLSMTVYEFYKQHINELDEQGKYDTKGTYTAAFYWVKRFLGGDEQFRALTFEQYNYNFLIELLPYIKRTHREEKRKDIKETTLFGYFKNYKALKNKAIKLGVVCADKDNFKDFSLSQFNTDTIKRAITVSELKKIQELQLAEGSRDWIVQKLFLFSFYARGMNMIDIAFLKRSNINNGVIQFHRRKTGGYFVIPLPKIALKIIADFEGLTCYDYVFPILNGKEPSDYRKKIKAKTFVVGFNKSLKRIADLAKLENINLTSYVARHSYATGLKKSGVPISEISELMGHESIEITKVYLEQFDPAHLAECDNKLFSQLS